MEDSKKHIGCVLYFNQQNYDWTMAAWKRILNRVSDFQSSYNAIEGLPAFNTKMFVELMQEGTYNVAKHLKDEAESQIKKAGITLTAIKEPIMQGINAEIDKLNDAVLKFKNEFNMQSTAVSNSMNADINLIEITATGPKLSDNAESIIKAENSVIIKTEKEAEVYERYQELKAMWDKFADDYCQNNFISKFAVVTSSQHRGIFVVDDKTKHLSIEPLAIEYMSK